MRAGSAARAALVITAAALAQACALKAPEPRIKTPSGRPEVTISGVTKKTVIDVIANHMLTDGYMIREMSDYRTVFLKRFSRSRHIDGKWIRYVKEERITCNVVDTSLGARVVATIEIVSRPGKPDEEVSEIRRGKAPSRIQNLLLRTRAELAR